MINQIINKLGKNNLLFAFALSTCLISVNFIANLFYAHFYMVSAKTLKQVVFTFLFAYVISFLKNNFRILITLLLLFFSIVEIGYYAFFRGYLQSYQLTLLFSEYTDIIDSLYSIRYDLVFILVGFAIMVYTMFYFAKLRMRNSKIITIVFLIFLIILPIRAYIRANTFTPTMKGFAYINMTFSLVDLVNNLVPKDNSKNFKEYQVKTTPESIQNVVVIMGESLSYKYMGLYNKDFNNTLNLDQLKTSSLFQCTRAISAGVNTPVSINSFFNNKREPENMKMISKNNVNILALAKKNGYIVHWYSTQEETGGNITSVIQNAHQIKTRQNYTEPVLDDVLIQELDNIDFSKKNFIVLHLRANHSPYEKYIPQSYKSNDYDESDYFNYKFNTYNDSIKYVDNILYKLFQKVEEKNDEFIIYFTSDHGERIGTKSDNGKYGHSELDIECAKVPFIVYSNQNIKKLPAILTHYDISKMITNSIGFDIINPNDDQKTYFLNSVRIDGTAGILNYKLKDIDNFLKD